MVGGVPPEIIERQECKQVLQRIGFSPEAAQAIVRDHGYDTAEKLSRLKPDNVDILMKTIRAPGGERDDGTRDPGISVPHSAHRAMISLCFILFHRVRCDLRPSLNMINNNNIYTMELQRKREELHDNDLYRKDRPRWDSVDPEQSLINIRDYFESLRGTNKAPCSYMLRPHIVPLVHKNQTYGFFEDPDKKMIERCPIIPIEQHGIYHGGTDAELLEEMHDLRSPEYAVDSAMCYAELKLIVEKTPAEICINKFRKTRDVRAAFKKLQTTFLGPGFTQRRAGQLEEELRNLKYKGEYKTNNFQSYVARHEKIYQQMQNLKNDGYAGIDPGTRVRYFLGGIDEPALRTAVQICESQDRYSIDFQACASYLTTMVQRTPAAKQVNVAATATEVDGVSLKNRDGTDRRLPPAKYSAGVYKMLSPKQKEWLWQDRKKAKANGEDIPGPKKRPSQPPKANKANKRLESAVAAQKRQISSLAAKNEKMVAALIASGFEIPESDPSSDEDGDGDRKMAANKKNPNLTKTNKRKK